MSKLRNRQKRLWCVFSSVTASVSVVLGVSLPLNWSNAALAQSPETAPAALTEALSQIEAAANRQDVEGVMQFYSPEFSSTEGLDRTALSQALTQLWEQYPQLSYSTRLQSWERVGDAIVAETITTISGRQEQAGRPMRIESTVRSRQRFEDQQIVAQETLAERTQLLFGDNPPNVMVTLPEQVNVGEQFNFDVIVREPLEEEVLLGVALEEQVSSSRYLNPSDLELEILPAGGIFQIGTAPETPQDRWLSAVLVREGGITIITQRLRIVEPVATSSRL